MRARLKSPKATTFRVPGSGSAINSAGANDVNTNESPVIPAVVIPKAVPVVPPSGARGSFPLPRKMKLPASPEEFGVPKGEVTEPPSSRTDWPTSSDVKSSAKVPNSIVKNSIFERPKVPLPELAPEIVIWNAVMPKVAASAVSFTGFANIVSSNVRVATALAPLPNRLPDQARSKSKSVACAGEAIIKNTATIPDEMTAPNDFVFFMLGAHYIF